MNRSVGHYIIVFPGFFCVFTTLFISFLYERFLKDLGPVSLSKSGIEFLNAPTSAAIPGTPHSVESLLFFDRSFLIFHFILYYH